MTRSTLHDAAVAIRGGRIVAVGPSETRVHPCCASAHCAPDVVVASMREREIAADEVRAVQAVVAPVSHDNLAYPRPENGMQARFSMHYAIALAVLHGAMRLADFAIEAVARPRVRTLLLTLAGQRISVD